MAMMATQGATCQAPMKIGNSATKPEKPGMPIETRPPTIKPIAAQGIFWKKPPRLGNIAGMRPVVDHADDSEEESRHHAVREHLHAGAEQALFVKGGKTDQHQPHVRDGRKADDIFEIGLDHGNEGAVDHVDRAQDQDPAGAQYCAPCRQEHDAYPQGGKGAHLHLNPRQQHRDGGRGGHVAVRGPGMEGEDAAQDGKTQEDKREPQLLEVERESRLFPAPA